MIPSNVRVAVSAQDAPIGQVCTPANELVVRGRFMIETAEPSPPASKSLVTVASRWTYHLRVKLIVAGKKQRFEIVAMTDRDGALLRNKDFGFHLARKPDGTYDLMRVDRVG